MMFVHICSNMSKLWNGIASKQKPKRSKQHQAFEFLTFTNIKKANMSTAKSNASLWALDRSTILQTCTYKNTDVEHIHIHTHTYCACLTMLCVCRF